MKKLILIAAAFGMIATSTQAADVYNGSLKDGPAKSYAQHVTIDTARGTFAGPFVGVSVNYDHLDVDHGGSLTPTEECETCIFRDALGEEGVSSRLPNFDGKGWGGGVRAGYMWQGGRLYGGPVLSVDFGSTDATFRYDDNFVNGKISLEKSWSAQIAGKLGLAVTDRIGVYAIAGWNVAQVEAKLSGEAAGIGGFGAKHDDTLTGFSYGAGVDVVLSGNWKGFAEYQRIELDDFKMSGSLFEDCVKFGYDANPTNDVIKVGLTYTFSD